MRTNDLIELIKTKLSTVASNVYYEVADEDALYPHVVFSFQQINLGDLSRQDYELDVDVWDKGEETETVENLCDSIEHLLHGANLPQKNILPTFYLIDRRILFDEDKEIRHRVVRFQIQNYER
jgi:hypothetical protein